MQAEAVIRALDLAPHPEGGHFRETFRDPAPEAGERPQAVVRAGHWQSARSLGAWTLVGCIVAPAFGFEGFELAPKGWTPGR